MDARKLGTVVVIVVAAIVVYFLNYRGAGAREYNDKIVNLQLETAKKIGALFSGFDVNRMERQHEEATTAIQNALSTLRAMEPYDGDSEFRDAAIAAFEFYDSVCQSEYFQMRDLVADGDATDEKIDTLKAIAADIQERESAIDARVHAAQAAFAKKHGFEVR
ncbi:MAG: hypothetical protein RDV41_01535 [Planctomycetota bacterium]|nr:hypothetical protein [Planctomycetota bacterium]